jgi:catechol 2,3-dioxygenase-like lactoylglutathione lyase family enzyme
MTVRRIVANIATDDPGRARAFYETLLDLEVVMDHGFILTLAADASAPPQLSFASEGGSATPVPDLSIEVTTSTRSIGGRNPRTSRFFTASPTSPGASGASTSAIRSAKF